MPQFFVMGEYMKNKLLFRKNLIKSAAAFLLVLCTAACSSGNDAYVMTIGNERVSCGEFMVYLMEQKKSFEQQGGEDIWEIDFDGVDAEEVAKQNAADTIVMVKTAVGQADKLGIEKSEDDAAHIKEEAKELYDEIVTELGSEEVKELDIDESLVKSIVTDGHIHQKVFDYVTEGFQVSEADFEEYLQKYYEDNKYRYLQVTVQEVFSPKGQENLAAMEEAYSLLQQGADFAEIQKEYSKGGREGSFVLDLSMLDSETQAKIYSAQTGSCVFLTQADGYYIFKIEDTEKNSIDNIRDGVRVEYIKEKKQEIYQTQNSKWSVDVTVTKNDEVWNNVGFEGYSG